MIGKCSSFWTTPTRVTPFWSIAYKDFSFNFQAINQIKTNNSWVENQLHQKINICRWRWIIIFSGRHKNDTLQCTVLFFYVFLKKVILSAISRRKKRLKKQWKIKFNPRIILFCLPLPLSVVISISTSSSDINWVLTTRHLLRTSEIKTEADTYRKVHIFSRAREDQDQIISFLWQQEKKQMLVQSNIHFVLKGHKGP